MISKDAAMSFLDSVGRPFNIECFVKSFLYMKFISGEQDNKKVWDSLIHDILKACISYDEAMDYINKNKLDKGLLMN